MKQLFSSMIVSMEAKYLSIEVVKDFVEEKVIRDDGAGEADPEILETLAAASDTISDTYGMSRPITASAQIRCAGLKGMLISSPRLRGSKKIEVPESMLKFGSKNFSGEHLSVLSFSRIRPTSIGLDVILRLEAGGCDGNVMLEAQKRLPGLAWFPEALNMCTSVPP